MNILKRELKAGFKPFIFWIIGLFVLVFAGMMKYEGISAASGTNLSELMDQFPRVVLAVLGMVGVDVNTLGGYYAILSYYALICAVIYAVHLGSNAVSRESVDKTYEFIFTKPCTRAHVLRVKLLAAWIYLAFFCLFYLMFSFSSISNLQSSENMNLQILLFTVSLFLISSMFIALSSFVSALSKQADKGSLYGNLIFLYAFIIGIIYDMLENGQLLKFISPLKYFSAADLLDKKLDPLFASICIVLTAAFLYGAFRSFQKKDLTAK